MNAESHIEPVSSEQPPDGQFDAEVLYEAISSCDADKDLHERAMKFLSRQDSPSLTVEGLAVARAFCLSMNQQPECDEFAESRYPRYARLWASFLCSDEASSRSDFLQEDLYAGGEGAASMTWPCRGLRPIRNPPGEPAAASDAPTVTLLFHESSGPKPVAWLGKEGWLRHADRLTVTEIELVLAVFDWRSSKPMLAWWVRQRPDILWRVHRLLLKRYCFWLLRPLRQARRQAGIDVPQYRAGELLRARPRVLALVLVGLVGVASVDLLVAFAYEAHWWAALACAFAALAVLWGTIHVDVFKQNRGVIRQKAHARRRTSVMWANFVGVAVLAVIVYALACLAVGTSASTDAGAFYAVRDLGPVLVPAVFPEGAGPGGVARQCLGFLTVACLAALLGALLQWIFEDNSAIEPV